MTPLYYWHGRANFGDLLSGPLLRHFAGIDTEWAAPADAQLVCIGSNLDVLPEHWRGVVAGAGKLHEDTVLSLGRATVLGVRGKLTARGVRGTYALGDPALLVDELVPIGDKLHNLGVVPHWSDQALARRFAHLDPYVIDPSWDPITVVEAIGSCKKIVSSSLHGVIVADSFDIPRRTEIFARAHLEGGAFKFHDYSSAINFPIEFGVLQHPPRSNIELLRGELFDMLRALPRSL